MNKAVFIAWRGGGEDRGHWSPVARLDGEYRFVHARGALTLPGYQPRTGEAFVPLAEERLPEMAVPGA